MSFTSEYLKLREKRKKEEKENIKENSGVKAPLYVNKTAALYANSGDEDIAPVTTKTTTKAKDEEKEEERTWFQKGAFEDGYQFGDVAKTILGVGQDISENVYTGILGMGEKAVDAGAYVVGGVGGLLGADKFKDEMGEFIAKDLYDEEKVAKTITKPTLANILGGSDNSVLGEKSDSLLQSGGQLAAQIGLQAVGVPWFVTSGVTAFGSEAENALNNGATYGAAGLSAAISAGAEILTEKISGGIKFGGKTLDDALVKSLSTSISNKAVRTMAKLGLDVVGEGSEEVISQVFSNLGSALYKDESIGELLASEEAVDEYIESFIGGAVLGGGMGGVNAIQSKSKGVDYASGLTASEESVVKKIYEDRIAEAEKDGELTNKQKSKIYDEVLEDMEKGGFSTDTIEEVLGGESYKAYKDAVDNEAALRKEYTELYRMKNGEKSDEQIDRQAELKKQLDELNGGRISGLKTKLNETMSGMVNGSRLAESYNERYKRTQKFEADLNQYDEKQKAIIQKAVDSGILNNTRRTHEFVDLISKISADKGVSFDFTNNQRLKESGFAIDGKQVNGFVKDGNVTLNIDSAKSLNSVVGHEIAHVLEGTDMYGELQKAVYDYAIKKGEYQVRREGIENTYNSVKDADFDSELTADLIGDYLFTDSDFVRNLSTEHRNVFQKIYDEIKYLCKVATAGSKEARQLERVKKAFEDAYRTESKAPSGVKHSISDSDGKQLTNESPTPDSDIRYSLSRNAELMDNAEKYNDENLGIRLDTARQQRQEIYDYMMRNADRLKMPEDIEGNTAIKNSSYDITEENTTVCIRSMAADALCDAVAEELGRPLTVEDTIRISQDLMNYTDSPECVYCYVATDRRAYREFLGSYHKQMTSAIEALKSGKNSAEVYEAFLDGRKDTKNMRNRFAMWEDIANGGKMISAKDLASEKMMQNAMRDPELAAQVKDARAYAQSASWAKKRQGYQAYNGHILNWSQRRINDLNKHYGLRFYSFSDFSPAFVLENMQQMTDAAVRGLKGLAYTKELDFVEIFAPTDVNINISVFGYDQNGVVAQDGMMGADWARAQELRNKYENVGITFVATNDTQIEWALNQDWIDVVIPYHLVRTGQAVAKHFGYTNYTAESADTKGANWQKGDKRTIYPSEHNNDKQTYLDAIAKANLEPRFARWVEHPNYMKLVNETRRAANDTPHMKAEFNVEAAKASLERMAKQGGYFVPIGGDYANMQDIAGDIANDIRAKTQYSLSDKAYMDAVNRGDTENAQMMVDEAARKSGYEYRMFHETDADNIHVFDISRGDHGATDYETPYGIFTKTSDKNIGLGSKQMALFVKARNTIRVEDREDVRNKIPGFEQYYNQIQAIDQKYDAIAEELEDAEFDALQEWIEENPDADMDVVYPTSYIIEGRPADIDSVQYQEAHRKYQENKAEWTKAYDAVAVKAKEFITNYLRDNGYDSMYFKVDGGSRGRQTDSLIVLDTNQVKSADAVTRDDNGNVISLSERFNPDNKDIRYSLSDANETPFKYGGWNVYGKDIMLPQDEVAPVGETVAQTAPKVTTPVMDRDDLYTEDVAPISEEDAVAFNRESFDSITDEDAPFEAEEDPYDVSYGMSNAELSGTGIDDNVAPDGGQWMSKKDENPFHERNWSGIGNRKVKAYMYENPEVKPFFQEEAAELLTELDATQKGERWYFYDEGAVGTGGDMTVGGTKRHTSQSIETMLDGWGMSYADIEKGLKAILEDNGAENIAAAKKIEFMLNDRLYNGYKDFFYGENIPPNQDYIDLVNANQVTAYSKENFDNLMANLDAFDISEEMTEDVAPAQQTTQNAAQTQQTAPVAEAYEAIRPAPNPPRKEPRMARATPAEQARASVLVEEPQTEKKKRNIWSKLKNNVLDKGMVFEDLSLKTGNRELQARWNSIRYAEGKAQRFMENGNEMSNSLKTIREEVESTGKTAEFYEYLYHKHNVSRMTLAERYADTENKPVFGYDVTAEVSRETAAELEKANPEFKQFARDVYDYMNTLREMLVEGGVISRETAMVWAEMYPHYVPIRRVGDDGLNINVPLDTGRTGVNAPIKRATGGSRNIMPLFETMALRTEQTFKAVAKNRFGVELKNTLGTTIDSEAMGIDEAIDSIDTQDGLLQEGKNGRSPTFTVFDNGEKVTFEITDEMYDAIKPTSEGMAYTNKVLNTASNIRRGMITEYNPWFLLKNAVKDVQDVLVNSQHAARTYVAIPKAINQMATNGQWYQEYLDNGGERNTYFEKDTHTFKAKNKVLDGLNFIGKANNIVEMLPRLAEYIASREAGQSIDVAMLDAARVTTNFAAGGDLTKLLNRNGATFLNASVQGAMQQVRNIREAKMNGLRGWANLAGKFVAAGLPALLLNHLIWDDDEEYEELSDYVKQNYYIVGKYGDGKFVRIPKGRTVSVIQDAFEQMEHLVTGDDEADLKGFLDLVITNLAPNNPIDNNIFSPIAQAAANKTWYGEDLVPSRLQKLPKAQQYDESTDSISKWLGETTNTSPYKWNYLIDQYSGVLGDTFLPMLTPEAESGDNSLVGNLIAPLKDMFTTDSVMKNQNVSDFYDTKDKLTTNANSDTATDEDALMSKYMNSVNADLAELYQKKREIQNSSLSDKEKYAAVRRIQEEITFIANDALQTYEDVRIDGGQATVGDRHYHLNKDGEWEKTTPEQLAKYQFLEDYGVSYEDYMADEDTKEEYDSVYSWYKNYPDKVTVSKAVTDNVIEYRRYTSALNDLHADKDSSGKSINGSRKDKVFDYINGLDIDYGAKCILFKSEYNADDTYNEDIFDYLNGRKDLSYEEKLTIMRELGFTVSSDGTITW